MSGTPFLSTILEWGFSDLTEDCCEVHPSSNIPSSEGSSSNVTCKARHLFLTSFTHFAMISRMEPKSKKQPWKRITLVLRVDLIDRVLEKAKLLQQGPNNFVNLCVEGVLDAMDAPGTGYDIHILSLYNQVKGKTFLTSKAIMSLVGALVPEIYEVDAQEQKFLMELVNNHEGRLTSEVFKGYRKLAQRMNMERIAHGKQLRPRRAFTREEFQRLLAIAGPRRALYLTAVFTGLRRGELAALEWDDVDLGAERPFLKARASTTKNRKEAVIGLHEDVVAELRLMQPRRAAPNKRVFEGLMPRIKRFRADLKRADVDYINARGQRADFHSLRYTLATNLALAGTPPRVAMEIMRHSDMRLTAKNVYRRRIVGSLG